MAAREGPIFDSASRTWLDIEVLESLRRFDGGGGDMSRARLEGTFILVGLVEYIG